MRSPRPGWTDAKRPPDPPAGGEDLLDTARAISSSGPAVLLAGTAEDGSLVRLAVTAGKVGRPQREEAATFSRQALGTWRRDSLFDYGIKGLDEGVFHRTTRELGCTALPDGPTIVISDTALRSYPPTLLRAVIGAASVRDDPAGLSRPMAAAPSLTWLAAARRLPSLGDGASRGLDARRTGGREHDGVRRRPLPGRLPGARRPARPARGASGRPGRRVAGDLSSPTAA